MEILINNGVIITADDDLVIPDGYLLIRDNQIVSIGKTSSLPKDARKANTQVIDAAGRVVMPGLINPHMHLYEQFARGMKMPKMVSFLEVLERFWWKFDNVLKEEDIYVSALIGLMESIKAGVTTIFDHHSSYGHIKNSLTAISEAFSQTCVRGVLGFEVSDRNGEKSCHKAIEENCSFLNDVAEKCLSPNYCLRGAFGLQASFTLSSSTIKAVHKANEEFNAPYHINVAEGSEDLEDSKSRYNSSVVRRLFDEGVLKNGTIAAHCVHINDADIAILKDSKAFVIHNPVSNMNYGVGRAPYIKMTSAGIPVGIGTDGMSASVFNDISAASVLHKESSDNLAAGWNETKNSVLKANSMLVSSIFGQKIGVLKPGATADVVISDYIPTTEIDSENYWGHFLSGVISSKIQTTIVNGKVLMLNRRLTTIDEISVIKEAKRLSSALWKRFGE